MDKATINRLAGSVHIIWNEPEKPVEYREYPKLVYLADGSYVKVDNAEEEAVARGESEYKEETKTVESVEPKRRGRPPKHKD